MIMATCRLCGKEITTQSWGYKHKKLNARIFTCKSCQSSTIKGFDFIQENKRGYLNG